MSIGYTQNSEKEARGAKYKICKNRIKRKKMSRKNLHKKINYETDWKMTQRIIYYATGYFSIDDTIIANKNIVNHFLLLFSIF